MNHDACPSQRVLLARQGGTQVDLISIPKRGQGNRKTMRDEKPIYIDNEQQRLFHCNSGRD